MATCKFVGEYFDLESRKGEDFKCNEKALDTGSCIFHDIDYLNPKDEITARNHKANVEDAFKKMVDKSLLDDHPLICIGYRIDHVKLANREFKKPVYFKDSKFYKADFYQSTFYGGAEFTDVEFFAKSNFYDTEFHRKGYFEGVKFFGESDFSRTKFFREARFTSAQFHRKTDFSEAQFSDLANFTRVNFMGETIFLRAKFSREARFTEAKFVSISNITDFSEARFSDTGYFFLTEFKGESRFNYTFFERPQIVFFNTNLSNVSFMNTDISNVRFGEEVLWGDEFKVADEIKLERLFKNSSKLGSKDLSSQGIKSLEGVKAIYRNLRENYEYRMRYDEASKFFVREMELKRKYRDCNRDSVTHKNSFFRKRLSLTGIYHYLFGYGESLRKIAFTGIGLFGLFSVAYWFITFNPYFLTDQSLSLDLAIKNSTTAAVSDMFQIKGQSLQPVDYIIRISTLPVLGILIIALKRKFERKFRH